VIDDKGKKGDANKRVIAALIEQDKLFARGRLKHTYPHSWRSKKPVIFRNTPQWFVYMDEAIEGNRATRCASARSTPSTRPPSTAQGQNRLRGMIEGRPDWVLSRQRAWGVPITVFTHKETARFCAIPAVNQRIVEAFHAEGADAWFKPTVPRRASWATTMMPTTMGSR
jgi:isoleucyl-tRNA synthetase